MTNTAQRNDPAYSPAPLHASTAGFDRDVEAAAGCLGETLSVEPALLAALEWLTNRESCGGSGTDETTK